MIKKPLFFLSLFAAVTLLFTACKPGDACDDVTCAESFVLTETPDACCFRVDTEDKTIYWSEDFSLDLNQDGLNDIIFDGEETSTGSGLQKSITLRLENGTEILVNSSNQIVTFAEGDEMVTANEIYAATEPQLVRVTDNSEYNGWPTGVDFAIMGLRIPIQGSNEYDYAYICMRVNPAGPLVTIAYYVSQIGI